MEKKKESSTTFNPLGMCEKLFNAFNINPTLRPLRRLTFRQHDQVAAATTTNNNNNSSPRPLSDHSSNSNMKDSGPQKKRPEPVAPEKKTPESSTQPEKTPLAKVKSKAEPKPQRQPPPPPPPPKAQPKPQKPPVPEKPKKEINERADEYIKSTKPKITSTGSGVGRATRTSK